MKLFILSRSSGISVSPHARRAAAAAAASTLEASGNGRLLVFMVITSHELKLSQWISRLTAEWKNVLNLLQNQEEHTEKINLLFNPQKVKVSQSSPPIGKRLRIRAESDVTLWQVGKLINLYLLQIKRHKVTVCKNIKICVEVKRIVRKSWKCVKTIKECLFNIVYIHSYSGI